MREACGDVMTRVGSGTLCYSLTSTKWEGCYSVGLISYVATDYVRCTITMNVIATSLPTHKPRWHSFPVF